MNKYVFVSGCALLLTACVSSEMGRQFDYNAAQTFKIGSTTRAQIISALGEPVNTGVNAEGKFIEYMYSKATMNSFQTMAAAYGIGSIQADTNNATCKYTFDASDVLKDFSCSGGSQ
jgi:outer membrane protein assembly factor BamE (lipoprotein component of BamABCDE complex)